MTEPKRIWFSEATTTIWKSEPTHDFQRDRCEVYVSVSHLLSEETVEAVADAFRRGVEHRPNCDLAAWDTLSDRARGCYTAIVRAALEAAVKEG